MGPKTQVLKEGQTKAWDPLQTIELEKLSPKLVSKVSELEGMSSFKHFTFFIELRNAGRREYASDRPHAGPMQVKKAQVWRRHLSEGSPTGPAGAPGRGRGGVGVYSYTTN